MRRGFALLPLGLSLLTIAEVVVFLSVAHLIGGAWAVLLVLASSVVGLALLRREGVRGWRRFRAAAVEGRPPGEQVSNSLVGLAGALLLALPGFLTAVVGVLLLVPPGRHMARRAIEGFTQKRMGAAVAGDLFGPRRVRVRRGAPVVVVPQEPPVHAPAAAIEGDVVEGEVLR
jgi:UPF0716 protein FxsA